MGVPVGGAFDTESLRLANALVGREDGEVAWERLTDRQRTKYRNIDKWWFALGYFISSYVLRRGFLDGAAGFSYAFYKLWYFWTVRLLIRERTSQHP